MVKVLVIDDEPNNVRLLSLDLEDAGYEVVEAFDGLQGWEVLEEQGSQIKVILLDRMMPNMDGMAFLEKIKKDERYAGIPIIMQTAAAEKEQVAEGVRAGVYYYLTKPYQEEILVSVVNAALKDYTSQASLKEELKKHRRCFGMVQECSWEFKTLEDCDYLVPFISSHFPQPESTMIGIMEMLVNAVEHGNLGITYDEKTQFNIDMCWEEEIAKRLKLPENSDKKATAHYKRYDDRIELTIKDEGEGFDWRQYMDFSTERALDNHGRGIAVSNKTCFDKVEYKGSGNVVVCTVMTTN